MLPAQTHSVLHATALVCSFMRYYTFRIIKEKIALARCIPESWCEGLRKSQSQTWPSWNQRR